MTTDTNYETGLVKVYWENIRHRVAKVEPFLAKLIDELTPDSSLPLYLAYYPYGANDADTQSSLFPMDKGFYRITDVCAPKDIVKNLGYSINSTPLGMVLDKELECYIDLKDQGITLPWLIYTPGKVFPFSRILNQKSQRIYEPNGLLSSTAGARSVFMLPNIGSAINHSNLQRDFNLKCHSPKSLYEHWHVFKEIVNSKVVNSDWRCCVMYFAEKWVTKIHNDKSWSRLKQYLHELAWHQYQYERNRIYYDITFSMIQKKRNLKPNPYLADTARHLFATALGAAPGYVPAINNESLPYQLLQNIFVSSYGLKKYFPTIMKPSHYCFETDNFPIYYSLQNPSTHVFSPKSREVSSTLSEMRELQHIMRIFLDELSQNDSVCRDTIIGKVAQEVQFQYFHNKVDRHGVINSSEQLEKIDRRFNKNHHKFKNSGAKFASDAPFVRGCISISRIRKKNNNN
ncbi:MAG: hypothetical protein H0W64_05300 [Gammaproteobacteria bacterium]|nr:hypothetical protein [Gammaproteobacteria bacterium]